MSRLIPFILVLSIAGAATPAFGFDGSDNPGTDNRGDNGLSREEARAIGRDECSEFKANFKENRQQFGKCVAAVAMDIRNEDVSAREACNAKDLSHERSDGETRSDFKACVLAARSGEDAAEDA